MDGIKREGWSALNLYEVELGYTLDGSTPTDDGPVMFDFRDRSISSNDRRASRPEFPSIPRIKFLWS